MVDVIIPKRFVHLLPENLKDQNFLERLLNNPRVPHEQKSQLFSDYLKLKLDAALQYDHLRYPVSNKVHKGTPSRIPDGYYYLGPDPEADPAKRRGEIIRINKKEILDRSHHLFWQIFNEGGVSTRRKVEIVADDIDWTMLADRPGIETSGVGVINLHDRIGIDNGVQCRHKALYAQIMFQAVGVESRYVPADVFFEDTGQSVGHALNLVQIDNEWHLLSATRAPRLRLSDGPVADRILLSPVPDQNIDINKNIYTWRPSFWAKTLITTRQAAYFQVK